jgi:hypothetical protein
MKCYKKKHDEKCGLDDIVNFLIEVNNIVDENEKQNKIVMCPYCLTPTQKSHNDDCDHIPCRCKKDFSFCCGAKRDPCLTHGLHYHRPSCRFVKNAEDDWVNRYIASGCKEDKYDPVGCCECKAMGFLCHLPNDLYKGVFPPELLDGYNIEPENDPRLAARVLPDAKVSDFV